MINNDIASTLARDFQMEPNPNNGELTNEDCTVGVVEDDNYLLPVETVTTPADSVEHLFRDDAPDLYEVQVGEDTQWYQVQFAEPLLQRTGKTFEGAFLFREMVDRHPACRAPLPGEGKWNFLIAGYYKE